MTAWNPRYVAYCRFMGHPEPDDMLGADRERWPGGLMTGFLLWGTARRREFERLHPWRLGMPSHEYEAAYDLWLMGQHGPLNKI